MHRFLSSLLALGLAAGMAAGQAVSFTGNVENDFPASQYHLDPGGIDVGLPASVASANNGAPSGWDLKGVAISYDAQTDALFVGLDFYGVAGDADGDGNPDAASPALLGLGGSDFSGFSGSESFTFAMDLNDDGVLDVVAGLPLGGDMSSFKVALFDNSTALGSDPLNNPYARFGVDLVSNTGIQPVMPNFAFSDLEFTIPNFSDLLLMFTTNDVQQFGFQAFAGSLEDAGIGEDFVQGIQSMTDTGPCVPIPNLYELRDVQANVQGQLPQSYDITTRFGLIEGYGCCVLYSLFLQPAEVILHGLPGQPRLDVGLFGVPNSILAVDAGAPGTNGASVACKDATFTLPANILPAGTPIYAQILAYPAGNNTMTFYTSNTITYIHPGMGLP